MSKILSDLVGEYVQVVTTQTATEQMDDGSVYTGPWALSGTVISLDDVVVCIEPPDSPPRFVFRAHIITIDISDKTAVQQTMPEPIDGGMH